MCGPRDQRKDRNAPDSGVRVSERWIRVRDLVKRFECLLRAWFQQLIRTLRLQSGREDFLLHNGLLCLTWGFERF